MIKIGKIAQAGDGLIPGTGHQDCLYRPVGILPKGDRVQVQIGQWPGHGIKIFMTILPPHKQSGRAAANLLAIGRNIADGKPMAAADMTRIGPKMPCARKVSWPLMPPSKTSVIAYPWVIPCDVA